MSETSGHEGFLTIRPNKLSLNAGTVVANRGAGDAKSTARPPPRGGPLFAKETHDPLIDTNQP